MTTLDDVMAALPPERRARIEQRSLELIQHEEHRRETVSRLRDLRKARHKTQLQVAQILALEQSSISKLESRKDLMLSTLNEFIQALGGELVMEVRFPDEPGMVFELTGLSNP